MFWVNDDSCTSPQSRNIVKADYAFAIVLPNNDYGGMATCAKCFLKR